MPATKTCEVEKKNKKIFIGSNCSNDYNGDPDTEKTTETKEEYEANYENKHGSFSGTLTTQGFGEGGETCEEILKPNLVKLIKLCIIVLRIAGAIIAIMLWWSNFLSKVSEPFLVVLNSLPKVALRTSYNYLGRCRNERNHSNGTCNFINCNYFRNLKWIFKYRQRTNKNGTNI